MKTCKKCGETKAPEEFRVGGKWERHDCKACHNIYQRRHRASRPLQYKQYALKRTFGISLEDYQAMWAAQDGCCDICREPEKGKKLAVDHDHVTGKIRALLCQSCNHGLGNYRDDPALLHRAIAYLGRHRGQVEDS